MKTRLHSTSAGDAWLRSLPLALALPPVIWIALAFSFHNASPSFSRTDLIPFSLALTVHLAAYAVFGLPLFFRYYAFPRSTIWDLRFAVLTGGCYGILGMLGLVLAGYLARGRMDVGANFFTDQFLWFSLIGAAYGVCTALAAWLRRPVGAGGVGTRDPHRLRHAPER